MREVWVVSTKAQALIITREVYWSITNILNQQLNLLVDICDDDTISILSTPVVNCFKDNLEDCGTLDLNIPIILIY